MVTSIDKNVCSNSNMYEKIKRRKRNSPVEITKLIVISKNETVDKTSAKNTKSNQSRKRKKTSNSKNNDSDTLSDSLPPTPPHTPKKKRKNVAIKVGSHLGSLCIGEGVARKKYVMKRKKHSTKNKSNPNPKELVSYKDFTPISMNGFMIPTCLKFERKIPKDCSPYGRTHSGLEKSKRAKLARESLKKLQLPKAKKLAVKTVTKKEVKNNNQLNVSFGGGVFDLEDDNLELATVKKPERKKFCVKTVS